MHYANVYLNIAGNIYTYISVSGFTMNESERLFLNSIRRILNSPGYNIIPILSQIQ